ncbi:hypothetical protein DPMN_070469 [Dreissena polymorpha]|uniref:Uncharacterized protein n=1 Tax=Dreissena polymorpha TaxID=45954 RepID=A0A9D4BNY2_DREPO|nr:hypothetical protein DPMN_070469 [Dreissena polymorpha]
MSWSERKYLDVKRNRQASLLLATLSLKEDTMYNWLAEEDSEHGIPTPTPSKPRANNENTQARESAVKYLNEVSNIKHQHIRRKTEAAQEKQNDKDKASTEGKLKVVTMDLQSLLLCPKRMLILSEIQEQIYVDHQFFRDYSNLSYYNSIRPGHVVTDIRVLKYTLNYSDSDFGEIHKSRNASPTFD